MRTLIALMVVALSLVAQGDSRAEASAIDDVDDVAAREWAMANYDQIAERVFGAPIAEEMPLDVSWRATARVRPAYDQGEFQLSLTKQTNGSATIEFIKLTSPLLSQLARLHGDQSVSSLSSEVAARAVRTERFVVASSDWLAMRKIVAAFEAIRTNVVVQNALVVDPQAYQLWIDGGSQRVYFSLLGPSSGGGAHPIIRWIDTARRQVEQVAQSSRSKSRTP